MVARFVAFFASSLSLVAAAQEPRPFAPLPLASLVSFRSRVVVYAGETTRSLTASNGTNCELRLPLPLPKDWEIGPEAPLTVIGGSRQKVRWDDSGKTVTFYRTNAIGESEGIAEYSGNHEVARRIRFAAAMGSFGGRPHEIARVFGIGGLHLRRAADDAVSLLCWKGRYASGGTFPGLPSLDDVAELLDVRLAE